MVRRFWADFAAHNARMPQQRFLAIDRRRWFALIGKPLDEKGYGEFDGNFRKAKSADFDVDLVPHKVLAGIRAQFVIVDIESEDDVFSRPTTLDGKRVMMIDEVSDSGSTVEIAQMLIRAAIPDIASTSGYVPFGHGIGDVASVNTPEGIALQMAGPPLWYDERDGSGGRGVGEVHEEYYRLGDRDDYKTASAYSAALKRYMGRFALSTPYLQMIDPESSKGYSPDNVKIVTDTEALKLHSDISQLLEDYRGGRILVAPYMIGSSKQENDAYAQTQGFSSARVLLEHYERLKHSQEG